MATPRKNDGKSNEGEGVIRIFQAFAVLVVAGLIGCFVYINGFGEDPKHPFKLGLDLAGGSHLVYEADVSTIDASEVPALMNVLREVVEKRINVFGVSEPVVYVERSSFVAEKQTDRLVIELPGVTDVSAAVEEIGRTPLLEFKLIDEEVLAAKDSAAVLEANIASSSATSSGQAVVGNIKVNGQLVSEMDPYIATGLTGRYLKSAALEFAGGQGQLANEPIVSIVFNSEGAELFQEITTEHTGESLAIFLDGELISAPNINEPIAGGKAIISGGFTPEEARDLAENLNFGALPVPIVLASTQTIDATLGAGVVEQSLSAGLFGIIAISLFMVLWYRAPGLIASVALSIYVLLSMALFMLIPVTLTAAGLAGFVLSLGMAVDANILVFERMKEEFRAGKSSREAAREGFSRAWSAIRDSNVTGLLSAIVLFWFGTPLIKGFALVLGLGTIVAMLSAVTLTRTLLVALPDVTRSDSGIWPYLFGSGLVKK